MCCPANKDYENKWENRKINESLLLQFVPRNKSTKLFVLCNESMTTKLK